MADISVGIVEDQARMREGLARLVAAMPGCRLAGSYSTMEAALPALDAEPVNVLLSDINLPGLSGIEGVRRLKASHPETQVLMLTVYEDDEHVFEAICAGASGYLLKDTSSARLREAIREVSDGGAPMTPEIARRVIEAFRRTPRVSREESRLSPRESDLLRLLADGHSYKTAADTLGVSLDTVRTHVRTTYEKLHVHSKSEAVTKAFRAGLLR